MEMDYENEGNLKHLKDTLSHPNMSRSSSSSSNSSTASFDLDFAYDKTGAGNSPTVDDSTAAASSPSSSFTAATTILPPPTVLMSGRPSPAGTPVSGYDPNRIPTSIFASKPVTPVDWSTNSTESLFSIQMPDGSFDYNALASRKGGAAGDHFALTHSKLPPAKSASPAPVPPSIAEVEETVLEEVTKEVVTEENQDDHAKEKAAALEGVRNSACASYKSDGSGTSGYSFAFPVFGGEGEKSKLDKANVESDHDPTACVGDEKAKAECEDPEEDSSSSSNLCLWWPSICCCTRPSCF